MGEIQKQMLRQLSAIETEQRIKIPLATESGSRAWGFPSPDSDYDCRFVLELNNHSIETIFFSRYNKYRLKNLSGSNICIWL